MQTLWNFVLAKIRTIGFRKMVINVFALVIISLVASSYSDVFFTFRNWENIGERISYTVIVGMPFTLLMISGEFDLSVGSTMALSGTVAALLSRGLPVETALLFGALAGLMVGIVNALLVVGVRINSFIATIGTQYAARGVALLLSGGAEVSSIPRSFADFGNMSFGNISIQNYVAIGMVFLFLLIQRTTSLGLYSVASGSNSQASFLSGVPVQRTRVVCFLLTGLAAGFAGVLQASQFGLGSPTTSVGLEFEVIVALVVGGTSLSGGEGDVFGTLLGALIVGAVFNAMNLAAVPSYWQTVTMGIILIAAVGIDRIVHYYSNLRKALKRRFTDTEIDVGL
jgi:ribose/xylose/arabinose/galactoside ABC-type transport system permease subunit